MKPRDRYRLKPIKPQVLRYVVLHHEGVGEPHFDFMFEREPGGALKSWRLERWPPGAFYCDAEEVADHRRAYLEYEGPVSRNRGTVRRVEGGTCTIEGTPGGPFTFRLASGHHLHLSRAGDATRRTSPKARRKWRACSFHSPAGHATP